MGLGLIGGSLGLALRQNKLVNAVIGYDPDWRTCQLARQMGAVDETISDLTGINEADLVVLATPVSTTIELLPTVVRHAPPRSVVMDTGSTKTEIVHQAARFFPPSGTRVFIGGHPLAGSEKNGITAARPDLFHNAVFVLVLPSGVESVPSALLALLQAIGARPFLLEAAEHDRAVALISHLPHLIAACLASTVRKAQSPEILRSLAAGGWRDTTRVARGRPALWADILLSNADHLLPAIESLQEQLTMVKDMLARQDRQSLHLFLERARQFLIAK
ncbi:prephenate dehydrogenase [Desulfurispora thermophila]|uniref:prephenate dehydrogenase n=1 Tax=Desulfurispora thermophila TaxID=265470 RepID=UPI0014615A4F|nr:prephenate dehydrogenase/arogenate dehydrogenase family protein [Desulfurispora thermophila]